MTIGAVLPGRLSAAPGRSAVVADREGERVDSAAYRLMTVQPPPRVIDRSTQVALYQVFGELKPGVSIEQARAEIEAIHARAQREHPYAVWRVDARW